MDPSPGIDPNGPDMGPSAPDMERGGSDKLPGGLIALGAPRHPSVAHAAERQPMKCRQTESTRLPTLRQPTYPRGGYRQ